MYGNYVLNCKSHKNDKHVMFQYLIDLVGRLGYWGYLIFFLGAKLGSVTF